MRDRLRRHQSARAAAALPRADRRQHAHRAAAGQQPRARRRFRRWRRCSAARSRCTATAGTRRSRCPTEERATLALRTQQIIACRDGRRQHGRSGRRLLRDRGAHERRSNATRGDPRRGSTPRGARSRRSNPAGSSARSRTSAYRAQQADRRRRRASSSASTRFRDRRERAADSDVHRIDPAGRSGNRSSACGRPRRPRRGAPGARRSTRVQRGGARTVRISSRRSSPPSRPARRSAKSPTPCARVFGEHTGRRTDDATAAPSRRSAPDGASDYGTDAVATAVDDVSFDCAAARRWDSSANPAAASR